MANLVLPASHSKIVPNGTSNLSGAKRNPVRAPMAIVFLCASIVILIWAGLLYDSRRSEVAALQQGRNDVSNLAVAFRENVTGIVNSIDQLMIAVDEDHGSHPNDYSIPRWVERSPLLQGLAFQVGLIGPDGMVRASTLPYKWRVDLSDRPHFRYHLDPSAPQPYISVPIFGRVSGKWMLQFTRRLTRDDGRFDGVVVVSVDPYYLSKFFDNVHLPKGGNAALVGRDGIVRARRALTEQTLGQDLTNSNLFQNLRVANDGTYLGVGKIGGTMNAIGYASLAAYPLVVGVAMPVDEILAAVRRQNSTYMVVGAIATLAIMTLGWLLMSDAKRRRQHELARHSHFLIQEQKILLDVALDNMSHGLLMFDSSNRLVIYNRRYLEMYGLSADVVRPGCTLRDLVDYRIEAGHFFSADPEQYLAEIQSAFAQNIIFSKTMHLNDGRIISIVHHSIADGGWVATHEDISEARRREDDLRRTNLQFDAALNNMTQGLLMFDEAGKLAISNRRFAEMYQLPWEKWQSLSSGVSPLRSMQLTSELSNIAPKHPEQIAAEIQGILRDHRKDQLIFERTDGRSYTASFGPMSNGGFVVTIDDITERRRKDDQILHMAHYDTLTDLPNRATFNETLGATFDRAAATDKRFAVLSIDLDHFKEANDTYGHLVGDGLLRELARRLQGAAGETFLARLGGDEFALIMADVVQPAAAAALADRLLATCADDFEVEGHRLRLAMSIGIAICPTDGADAKTLMTNADAALYRAKAETRGMAMFFEPEMSVRLRERYALQEDLRLAVDRGELRLYYQPQLKISGEAVGLEALVRWQCPKRGMVEPGTFIPIAEESSLIISLGEWVLREACREAASWPTQLTIAVNISPVQFHHGDLSRLVHTILLETGLAPGRLELEITENVMVDDFSRAVSILNQLKSLGVRIALDDFGTGYSSLSYLQSFRCDKVKIDRIFIRDLEQNRHSRSIVRAVIGLGRSLELVILAEGVETEAQHAFLVQEGCDEVQGYLMGRPLPIANYAKLVGGQMVAAHNFAIAG